MSSLLSFSSIYGIPHTKHQQVDMESLNKEMLRMGMYSGAISCAPRESIRIFRISLGPFI